MSMEVQISVNGKPIRRLRITNRTEKPTGTNTYWWLYTDLSEDRPYRRMFSQKEGLLEHEMEDGAMALLSKVAAAAAASETPVEAPVEDQT